MKGEIATVKVSSGMVQEEAVRFIEERVAEMNGKVVKKETLEDGTIEMTLEMQVP